MPSKDHTLTAEQSALAGVYVLIGVPVDQLPYSPAMELLVQEYSRRIGRTATARECFAELLYLRKRGLLPRIRRRVA
mgnify:FL=1